MTHWQTSTYATFHRPTFARNMVSTSQPLAAQAGLRALAKGGNAVDAALATAITLTIVEPISNGLGSDAFAIIWDGSALHGLNASGRAPAAWTPEYFKGKIPARGWNSVTVPGAVSAWLTLSERFGKLPFEALFETAIGYARDGFPVSEFVSRRWDFPQRSCQTAAPRVPGKGSGFLTRQDRWRSSPGRAARPSTGASWRNR
jgi:gamma-glutamyltranspeptidase/glutathione hydrolase